jgi:hypothetical protein
VTEVSDRHRFKKVGAERFKVGSQELAADVLGFLAMERVRSRQQYDERRPR